MNKKDGTILKSDVIELIDTQIRINITKDRNDIAIDLYNLIDAINNIPAREATWLSDTDGAWKCSNCGHRFFNGTGRWPNHCSECGYMMIKYKNI